MSDAIPYMGAATPASATCYSEDRILRSIYSNESYAIECDTRDIVGLTIQLGTRFRTSCRVGALWHSDAATLGRAFLYASGEPARITVDGECRILQLKLPRVDVDRLLLENHDEPNGASALRPLHGQPDFTLLRLLSTALVRPGGVDGMVVQTIVAALADQYGRGKHIARRRGLSPAALRRVKCLVESDLQSVTLDAMATASGLSLYHFAREFRHETGQTPWAFVMEKRAWLAVQRLSTGLSIDEAAREAGFVHASHMGRAFRRHFGIAPGALRRRLFP